MEILFAFKQEVQNFRYTWSVGTKGEVLKYQIRQRDAIWSKEVIFWKIWPRRSRLRRPENELSGIKDQIQKEEEEAEETENEKTLTSEPVKRSEKRIYEIVKRRLGPIDHGREKVSDLPINIVYGKKDTTKQSVWNFMNRKDVEKELDEFEKQHQRIPLQVNYR